MPYFTLARRTTRHPAVPWVWKGPGSALAPVVSAGLDRQGTGVRGQRLQCSLILRVAGEAVTPQVGPRG